MKKTLNTLKSLGFILLFLCSSVKGVNAQTETFNYTGTVQTYTVPDGITLIEIETWGAQGGSAVGLDGMSAAGGLGGYSTGELDVIPGQVLNVYVGGTAGPYGAGGFNGGGQAATNYGCGGGGASDVRIAPYTFTDRQIVAGGGGGGSFGSYGHVGGIGGGLNGGAGDSGHGFTAGGGGTQVAGGYAGCCYGSASAGFFGLGASPGDYHNAGGGGGWYGGGSGAGYAGAGGGSSYIDGVTDGTTTSGIRSGNGLVLIHTACDPLTVTASVTELCDGEELTLEAVSDNGGIISWDGGVSNGVPFVPPSTGIITYTATSDDDEDCWAFVQIEVFELPTVIASVDQIEICDGDAVVFSESGDADTYSWDPAEVTSGIPFTPVVGVATYTLTGIVDATGCQNFSELEVTVNELPIISAGEDLEICMGNEVTLVGSGLGVDGSYSWDGGVVDDTPFEPLMTNSYILTGTDGNDCENTDTVLVTVYALPAIEAGESEAVCYGESIALSGSGLADPDGYIWSDGVLNEMPFIPELTQFYHLEGTDENGCSNIDSVWIIVNELPEIYAGEDQAICIGEEIVLNGSGAGLGGLYSWTEGVTDGVVFNPMVSASYILTGTDANGCENTDTVEVEVYSLPPVNAGEDISICIGQTVVLSASGAGVGGIYTWEDGVINDTPFEPTSTNSYTVIGIDENGCENTDEVLVTVNPLPIIEAGEDLVICEQEEVELNGSGAGPDGTYTWNLEVIDGETFIPNVAGDYIVVGVDFNGCENTDTLTITLLDLPEINGGNDQRICLENEILLMVVDKDSELNYSWDNGVEDGVSFIGYYEEETIYTVTAVNMDGCENSDEVHVEVINCDTILVFPSGFSPNNDGVNDYLEFRGIDSDEQMYLAVYNEWGMKLFESTDYQNDWDGRNQLGTAIEKGQELPVGTYYYILEYGENNVVKNYIYIER